MFPWILSRSCFHFNRKIISLPIGISVSSVRSGWSRGGARGTPLPLIFLFFRWKKKKWLKEERPTEKVYYSRAPSLAEDLDPPLARDTRSQTCNTIPSWFHLFLFSFFFIWFSLLVSTFILITIARNKTQTTNGRVEREATTLGNNRLFVILKIDQSIADSSLRLSKTIFSRLPWQFDRLHLYSLVKRTMVFSKRLVYEGNANIGLEPSTSSSGWFRHATIQLLFGTFLNLTFSRGYWK